MALGDIVLFDSFKVDLGRKVHDLGADTFKVAMITNALTPAANTPAPHWGGTGTTNLATNQVTPGGNYPSGGFTLAGVTWANLSGVIEFKSNKVTLSQDPANPNNARWSIIYNDTDANKRAVGWLDLGSVRDFSQASGEVLWDNVDGNGTILRWPAAV